MTLLSWNILLHNCLDHVSQSLGYNKARILGSIESQISNNWTKGRISTKDMLHFYVLKDLHLDLGILEKKDKKMIIQRPPPTIGELLVWKEEIVEGKMNHQHYHQHDHHHYLPPFPSSISPSSYFLPTWDIKLLASLWCSSPVNPSWRFLRTNYCLQH